MELQMDKETAKQKRERLELLEQKQKLKAVYPHRYAWKHYTWSRKFYESRARECYLVAANQVGKSSVNIRKMIEWATNMELWEELWPMISHIGNPDQFWYLYPTKDVATIEFHTKWTQFLPKGEHKDTGPTAWTADFDKKKITSLTFTNTGVTIYFKTYSQNIQDLQSGTVFMMGWDEELPAEHLPELQARLNATDGYMTGVFTATLGQEHWRKCMEERGPLETHPEAFKQNISLYECLKFEDGTPSHWTHDKIERAKAKCPTDAEIQRRIYGRFIAAGGLVFPSFSPTRNRCPKKPIPRNWVVYNAVDPGAGGMSAHPTGIIFVAVSPDYKQGRVFKAWRGDKIPTSHPDIVNKLKELKDPILAPDGKELVPPIKPLQQKYDWHSKDFELVATGMGETFLKAEKNHEIGEGMVNSLFKFGMLQIDQDDSDEGAELEKLVGELTSLLKTTPKNKACDDLCDALRYTVADIPWDFEAVFENLDFAARLQKDLLPKKKKVETEVERGDRERMEWARKSLHGEKGPENVGDELEYWNSEYGT